MRRLLSNLCRLPGRTWRGLWQLTSPAYRLQLEADRRVPGWLTAERRRELAAIPGFSSQRELNLLAYLCARSPAGGCVVEIGAYKGRSTAWLVEMAERRDDRPVVVSIDPHQRETWEAFRDVVVRFRLKERGLEVHRALSRDVGQGWSRPISFLWIDGSHEYPDVVDDIILFTPHVIPGGWVVFDDARGGKFPGVERAIAERMACSPLFEHLGAAKHFELFRRRAT